jgi:hypothetical protein
MTSQFGKTNSWDVFVGMSCHSVGHVNCLVTATGNGSSVKTLHILSERGLQTVTCKTLIYFIVDSTHFQMWCLDFATIVERNK